MTVKDVALRALENYRGDDLYRARRAFTGLSSEDMGKQYGQSGRTRLEILTEYERHDADVAAAIAWVSSQANPEANANAKDRPGFPFLRPRRGRIAN